MAESGRQRSIITREKLLDAAAADFARLGYASTNLEQVASRLQLTKGAIYGHFPSKAAVAAELGRRFESVITEACEQVARQQSPPTERIHALADSVQAAIESSVQIEAGLRITVDQARAARAPAPALVELHARFAALFRECAAAGGRSSGHADPCETRWDQAAGLVLSVLLGADAAARATGAAPVPPIAVLSVLYPASRGGDGDGDGQ
jgi:AcrR family transcriptional regulator